MSISIRYAEGRQRQLFAEDGPVATPKTVFAHVENNGYAEAQETFNALLRSTYTRENATFERVMEKVIDDMSEFHGRALDTWKTNFESALVLETMAAHIFYKNYYLLEFDKYPTLEEINRMDGRTHHVTWLTTLIKKVHRKRDMDAYTATLYTCNYNMLKKSYAFGLNVFLSDEKTVQSSKPHVIASGLLQFLGMANIETLSSLSEYYAHAVNNLWKIYSLVTMDQCTQGNAACFSVSLFTHFLKFMYATDATSFCLTEERIIIHVDENGRLFKPTVFEDNVRAKIEECKQKGKRVIFVSIELWVYDTKTKQKMSNHALSLMIDTEKRSVYCYDSNHSANEAKPLYNAVVKNEIEKIDVFISEAYIVAMRENEIFLNHHGIDVFLAVLSFYSDDKNVKLQETDVKACINNFLKLHVQKYIDSHSFDL